MYSTWDAHVLQKIFLFIRCFVLTFLGFNFLSFAGREQTLSLRMTSFKLQSLLPPTRTRRPATSALSHTVNNEEKGMGSEVQQQTETAKPRKNKTARMKVVTGSPPPMKINIISPMTSPAELAPGVQRKEKEEAPLQRMNLRRKRLLETIFPKPVTRRKML
ncbi:hypothetical protein SKAU_G00194270 [Synaphobranchus kaupii]|uniref:Uncharacterized protein n=1 Tax=Synaphobranchus kaupii TaxID=118154 RepID=A0A9Q1IXK1_SYNKA|nr:hypothetical protein SKAU_G00194270 [Synaphobranchus kaupii]